MDMPKLQPIPISTQSRLWPMRWWIQVTARRQWQLLEDWRYELPNSRIIVIPKGFIFDGSSYPTIIWLLLSPTGIMLTSVIIHDFSYHYQYLWAIDSKEKIYKYNHHKKRQSWDNLARMVGIRRNGLSLIDNTIWLMVFCFGWINWRRCRRKNAKELTPG